MSKIFPNRERSFGKNQNKKKKKQIMENDTSKDSKTKESKKTRDEEEGKKVTKIIRSQKWKVGSGFQPQNERKPIQESNLKIFYFF